MYNKIYRSMRFLCILTLLLSFLLMLAVSYSVFVSNMKSSLEDEAKIISALLSRTPGEAALLESIAPSPDVRLTLLSPDGDILFDSLKDSDAPSGSKYVFSPSDKNYLNASVTLDSGNTLYCTKTSFDLLSLFYTVLLFLLLMTVFIYILSIIIAKRLTDNIVTPITQSSADEYDEIRPLTERIKLLNKEIKRQIEMANAQKQQLQLITENMNEGLVVIDENGNILSINNFATNIFNIREYEVKGKHYTNLTKNDVFAGAVSLALGRSRASALLEMGELDYRIFCSPVINKESFKGVIILLFDVTSTSQSERLRREFSANVSHELKTPLTSINGYAQIISGGLAASDDIPDFASKIAKESNRLMMLIEDIMRLSKLDEKAPAADEKTSFSIKEASLEVMAALGQKAEKLSLTMQCEGADFCVNANRSQVVELIYNICDNAIKYNKNGGGVTFTLSEGTLSISDTGIGIPGEYLGRIFERFFRVDKSHSKKVDGTGLGLSIVKHIAKQNNIDIDVKSTLGIGTTFILTFK